MEPFASGRFCGTTAPPPLFRPLDPPEPSSSAHAKKPQPSLMPLEQPKNLRPLFGPSFVTVRSTAGIEQPQDGMS